MKKIFQVWFLLIFILIVGCDSIVKVTAKSPTIVPAFIQQSQTPASSVVQKVMVQGGVQVPQGFGIKNLKISDTKIEVSLSVAAIGGAIVIGTIYGATDNNNTEIYKGNVDENGKYNIDLPEGKRYILKVIPKDANIQSEGFLKAILDVPTKNTSNQAPLQQNINPQTTAVAEIYKEAAKTGDQNILKLSPKAFEQDTSLQQKVEKVKEAINNYLLSLKAADLKNTDISSVVHEFVKQALQNNIQSPPAIPPSVNPPITDDSSMTLNPPIIDELTPSSGYTGDYCTIKGKEFGEKGGRILFVRKNSSYTGEIARILFWSGERILITTPDISSASYDVMVETSNNVKSNGKEFVLVSVSVGGGGGGGGGGFNPPPSSPPGSNNPVPALTSISPTGELTGNPDFTLTLNGNNFVPSSVVNFKGADIVPTYVGPTQLTAVIPAASISVSGTVYVYVKNPAPGGGNSVSLPFNVGSPNPVPGLTSLIPTECLIDSADFMLTVNGNSFIGSSYITFNGQVMTTTFMSSTQLSCTIPTSKVAVTGTVQVTVTTLAPGGGTTGPQNFTIKYPAPTITQLTPWYVAENNAVNPLRIIGTNFFPTTTVTFNGISYTPFYIDSTELQINVPGTATTPSGSTKAVVATNPAPGGGSANTDFYIDNPAPIINSFTPSTAIVGGEGVLKILGFNFLPGSTASFDGNPKAVTYISPTEIRISIDLADTTTPGIYPIEVTNAGPGGGTNIKNFTITGPIETIGGFGGGHSRVTYYAPQNLALIANRDSWAFYIVDLNNPPLAIDTNIWMNQPTSVAVHTGKKIAVVTENGSSSISVVDLDPLNPTYKTVIGTLGGLNQPKYVNIDEGTNRAYISNRRCQARVDKINLDDPTNPTLIASYSMGSCIDNAAYNPVDMKILGLDVDNSRFYIWDTLGGLVNSISMSNPKFIKIDAPNQRAFVSGRHGSRYIKIIDLNTYQTIKSYGSANDLGDRNLGWLEYDAANNRVAICSRGAEGLNKITVINLADDSYYSLFSQCGTNGIAFISNNRLIVVNRCGQIELMQLP